MKKDNIESLSGQTLFVGIDVYKKSFHVTLRTFDCELSSQSIPASCAALQKLLSPIKALDIAYSGPLRSRIPAHFDHGFRPTSITDSGHFDHHG